MCYMLVYACKYSTKKMSRYGDTYPFNTFIQDIYSTITWKLESTLGKGGRATAPVGQGGTGSRTLFLGVCLMIMN